MGYQKLTIIPFKVAAQRASDRVFSVQLIPSGSILMAQLQCTLLSGKIHSGICNLRICTAQTAIWKSAQQVWPQWATI